MNQNLEEIFIGKLSGSLLLFSRQGSAYRFLCPHCQFSGKNKKGKQYSPSEAKGYLYQIASAWNFKCHKCGAHQAFEKFLAVVSPQLHLEYVRIRDELGTTGFQTNCPSLETILKQRGLLRTHLPAKTPPQPQQHLQGASTPVADASVSSGHPEPSVTRLPRLSPEQQAGQQSRLNHLIKQREQRRRERSGELW